MVLLSLLFSPQQSSIELDPQLQTPIVLDESIRPLPELLKSLSNRSGITLRAAQAISDFKIDAFVKDEKLGTVLQKLAEAINAEWTKDQSGYTINMSVSARNNERNFLEAEEKLAMEKVDFKIDVARLQAKLIAPTNEYRIPKETLDYFKQNPNQSGIMGGDGDRPFAYLKPDLQKTSDSLKAAITEKQNAAKIYELKVRQKALEELIEASANMVKARLLGSMTNEEIKQFKSGLPFSISNLPDSKFQFSNGDRINAMIPYKNGEIAPTTVLGLSRVVPGTYEVSYTEYTYAEGSSGIMGGGSQLFPFNTVPEELKKLPFYTNLMAWSQNESIQAAFPQKMRPAKSWDSPFSLKGFRFGDHLRWIHQATGIPIIAAADRIMSKTYVLNRPKPTAGECISEFLSKENAFARKSGDFLLAKSAMHWRKRAWELPESTIRAMESKQKWTVEDHARVATNITEFQARLLSNTGGYLVTFPTRIYQQSLVPLQIYGLLSPDQMKTVNSANGLRYDTMNGRQQAQFRFGMFEAMLNGSSINKETLLRMVKTGLNASAFQNMSFRAITDSKANVIFGKTVLEGVEIQPELKIDGPMYEFEFAENGQRVVSFWGIGL